MSKYDEGFCEYPAHVTNNFVKAAEVTKKLHCTLEEAFKFLAEDEKEVYAGEDQSSLIQFRLQKSKYKLTYN